MTLEEEVKQMVDKILAGDKTIDVTDIIKLIDKRGEKISTQHILLSVSFSKMDVDAALKKTLSIYHKSNNDPFVFDSLSVDYYNQYSNQSGVYVNASPNEIHYSILDNLYNLTEFKLSQPIEVDNSYILIYLYKHNLKRAVRISKGITTLYY